MSDSSGGGYAGDEKRLSGVRLRKFIDILVEDAASSSSFRAAVADISEQGMRIIADRYLPEGTTYRFAMKSPPNLSLKGEVRWIRDFERGTYQLGVLLIDLTEEDRKRLTGYLDMERRRLATQG
jgi:hypothetical protein